MIGDKKVRKLIKNVKELQEISIEKQITIIQNMVKENEDKVEALNLRVKKLENKTLMGV